MNYYMNPHPALACSPLPSMGEGTGARAGYRNCLYGHDMRSHPSAKTLNLFPVSALCRLHPNTAKALAFFPPLPLPQHPPIGELPYRLVVGR